MPCRSVVLTVAPLHCYFVSRIVLSILHAVLVSTEALWGGVLGSLIYPYINYGSEKFFT